MKEVTQAHQALWVGLRGPGLPTDLLYAPKSPYFSLLKCISNNLTYYVYIIASVMLEGMTDTRSPALTLSAAARTCYGAHCLRAQREVCSS